MVVYNVFLRKVQRFICVNYNVFVVMGPIFFYVFDVMFLGLAVAPASALLPLLLQSGFGKVLVLVMVPGLRSFNGELYDTVLHFCTWQLVLGALWCFAIMPLCA